MNINKEKLNEVSEKIDTTVNKLKNSEVGKTVLGDDGKFDKEDIKRLVNETKESKIGKTILGDDGKFDGDDVKRLTEETKDAVKNAVNKAKELLSDK